MTRQKLYNVILRQAAEILETTRHRPCKSVARMRRPRRRSNRRPACETGQQFIVERARTEPHCARLDDVAVASRCNPSANLLHCRLVLPNYLIGNCTWISGPTAFGPSNNCSRQPPIKEHGTFTTIDRSMKRFNKSSAVSPAVLPI